MEFIWIGDEAGVYIDGVVGCCVDFGASLVAGRSFSDYSGFYVEAVMLVGSFVGGVGLFFWNSQMSPKML